MHVDMKTFYVFFKIIKLKVYIYVLLYSPYSNIDIVIVLLRYFYVMMNCKI